MERSKRVELFLAAFDECEARDYKIGDRNVNGFCEMVQLHLNGWTSGIPVSPTAINVIEHPLIAKFRPVPFADVPQGIQYWFWRGEWKHRIPVAWAIKREYNQLINE